MRGFLPKIMLRSNRVFHWLIAQWQWPAASLFAGCFLLLLVPLWYVAAGPVLAVVFLQLPIYMLHQWEEHAGDRFRKYVNLHVGGGREALTPWATFWINSLGVWLVDLVALYLAVFVRPALGLIAVYLPLVNGLAHVGQAVALGEYNPGLWTAVVLFPPTAGWGLYVIGTLGADWSAQLIGIAVAVAVHVAIIIHVVRRIRRLSAAEGQVATSQ